MKKNNYSLTDDTIKQIYLQCFADKFNLTKFIENCYLKISQQDKPKSINVAIYCEVNNLDTYIEVIDDKITKSLNHKTRLRWRDPVFNLFNLNLYTYDKINLLCGESFDYVFLLDKNLEDLDKADQSILRAYMRSFHWEHIYNIRSL